MTQNVYDDPDFFGAYAGLRRSAEGLDGAPEWSRLRAMLPDLGGLRVADLGCGYGWFSRWARAQGASHVLGIDVSERMLARAGAATADRGITYERADLEGIDLAEGAFDLAYSSLVLHYLADLGRLLAQVHRALAPGGRFVFSAEHPVYTAPSLPGWVVDAEGRRTWLLDRYTFEGPRAVEWLGTRVLKHHRTLGTTLTLLVRAGFVVEHVEEFAPTEEQVAADPALAEERERPMFLLIAADRR
jgi:SAM-dependent methyltransferase